MQFKYPELLWGLLLLIIPVLIHLFQLRRFKKTPFTNVKLLQKVLSESRRSNILKKWLLLFTRLALLSALIVAFAQPFFAEKTALQQKEMVIYLDDSFSMQAKKNGRTLLDHAVQELAKAIPKNLKFSLFTNTKTFKDVAINDIQNDLLSLTYAPQQLELEEIGLKGSTLFSNTENTLKSLVFISDFQGRKRSKTTDSTETTLPLFLPIIPDKIENVAIDSLYVASTSSENIEIKVLLSAVGSVQDIAVSLFNGEKLIAKTSAAFNEDNSGEISFTLPANEPIKGKLEISDTGLAYDNRFYFNIDEKEKIKVLSIGATDENYLNRIFLEDEFLFSAHALRDLNYGTLSQQHLILLNELEAIPVSLATGIKSFTDNGGSLVIIPGEQIALGSYNQLVSAFFSTSLDSLSNAAQNITGITFAHPLYQNVFDKSVSNFQYPKVVHYYPVRTFAPTALSYQDGSPFLAGNDGMYFFSAPLSGANSNFKNSPLIVPTFYNMAINSLKLPQLYHILGEQTEIDVLYQLDQDDILKATKETFEFIPRQQSTANKVTLFFEENPQEDGTFTIGDDNTPVKNISFNYTRNESKLDYLEIPKQESIASLFERMQKDNRINELWKWFVILAIVFMLIEILVQKFVK